MSSDFEDALFQVPSVRRFTSDLLDDLINRRSAIVLLPSGSDINLLWANIRSELWSKEIVIEEINLPQSAIEKNPIEIMSQELEIEWQSPETPRTLENLYNSRNLPDVIHISGIENLPERMRKDWLDHFSLWGQTSQQRVNNSYLPTSLLLTIEANEILFCLPDTDIYLAVHWWWGFPSILETHLLCREGNEIDQIGPIEQWREYILPSLFSCDIDYLRFLWDVTEYDIEQLVPYVKEFSQIRGWTLDALRLWGVDQSRPWQKKFNSQKAPPLEFRKLWANGLIYMTPEFGIELHSAVLATLGKTNLFQHRLWRAQAELILPVIDSLRIRVCTHLTETYGDGWPYRWDMPESDEEYGSVNDPLVVQWGYLDHLLSNNRKFRSQRNLLPVVSLGRKIRNEIAHNRPIPYKTLLQEPKQI